MTQIPTPLPVPRGQRGNGPGCLLAIVGFVVLCILPFAGTVLNGFGEDTAPRSVVGESDTTAVLSSLEAEATWHLTETVHVGGRPAVTSLRFDLIGSGTTGITTDDVAIAVYDEASGAALALGTSGNPGSSSGVVGGDIVVPCRSIEICGGQYRVTLRLLRNAPVRARLTVLGSAGYAPDPAPGDARVDLVLTP